jgi:hypothetical protein
VLLQVALAMQCLPWKEQQLGFADHCAWEQVLWLLSCCLQDNAGTVGPPMPCLGLRLESVPEMNYDATANPPRGEVRSSKPLSHAQ